jgi:prophage regulatory protein
MRKKQDKAGSHAELCPVCGMMRMPNRAQSELPANGYVRQKWIAAYLPISKSKLWRDCQAGTFPKPYKLGPRVTGWRTSDVRQWMLDNGLMLDGDTPAANAR